MELPQVFHDYCIWFSQDSDYIHGPTLEDMFAGSLDGVKPEKHQELRDFIQGLLTGPYSEMELLEALQAANADMLPRDLDSVRPFYKYMRDVIDSRIKARQGGNSG
jgi:hypothetical protein